MLIFKPIASPPSIYQLSLREKEGERKNQAGHFFFFNYRSCLKRNTRQKIFLKGTLNRPRCPKNYYITWKCNIWYTLEFPGEHPVLKYLLWSGKPNLVYICLFVYCEGRAECLFLPYKNCYGNIGIGISFIFLCAHFPPFNFRGFPGGAVVGSLPANAGDTGSSPGLGGSHMLWSNWAREPQLLSLRVWSLCSATREAAIVRGPCTAMKSGPRSPQIEKALAQKQRSNTAINK